MTRFEVMWKIIKFGRMQEKMLLMKGETDKAYQIEDARDSLILLWSDTNRIEDVIVQLELMTNYSIDEKGCWHFDDIYFVEDKLTRVLLIDLKKEFISKTGGKKL